MALVKLNGSHNKVKSQKSGNEAKESWRHGKEGREKEGKKERGRWRGRGGRKPSGCVTSMYEIVKELT